MFSFLFPKNIQYDLSGRYTATDIAKYIVYKCSLDESPISNLQLQKILYYLQKHFLQTYHFALFSDEFEAWPFGPVIRNIYFKYCGYGAMPIYDIQDYNLNLGGNDREIIDEIVEQKRKLNPWAMVNETHAEGKAWNIVYKNGLGREDIISKGMILNYG